MYPPIKYYIRLTVVVLNVNSDGSCIVDCNLRNIAPQKQRERLSVFKNIVIDNRNLIECAADQWGYRERENDVIHHHADQSFQHIQ